MELLEEKRICFMVHRLSFLFLIGNKGLNGERDIRYKPDTSCCNKSWAWE